MRNGIGMRVQRFSVGMWGTWVEIRKMWGIRVAMHGIKVKNLSKVVEITWNSNGNIELKDWREAKVINLVSCI